jgi:hypothetical protein
MGLTPVLLLDYIFNGQLNDLIVPLSSQSGGLEAPQTNLISGQIHIGSPANEEVINSVKRALLTSPSDGLYFSQNGFAPIPQTSNYNKSAVNPMVDLTPGSIKINWPQRDQNYNPGETIPVSISSNNGINKVIFEAITSPDGITMVDTTLSNGNIYYKIPQNSFGNLEFVVFGYNINTLIGFDTLSINVNVTSILDSITFSDEAIYVMENNVTPVSVVGWFNNGYHNDISLNSDVEFILADTVSAKVEQKNIIEGKTQGINMLTVKCQDKVLYIPVYVFATDTVSSVFTNIDNTEYLIKVIPSEYISIFPNPASDKIQVVHSAQGTIEIYNVQGTLLKSELSNDEETVIDISSLPDGVYMVRLKANNCISGAKFIKQ